MSAVNDRKAFTLIEVIIVLAIIGILAGVAVPLALKIFERTAEDATNEEMVNLKKAMIGDPEKLQSSVRSDFGFLGDIGCLPTAAFPSAPALDRLLTQGTYPGWSPPGPTAQIGTGWKGPYITGAATGQAAAEFQNDQWGNPYTYSPVAGTCPLTGTLFSNGPNGSNEAGGGDDISYSIGATETFATVSAFIKAPNGNPVGASTVTLNFPSNGTLTTSPPATADSSGFFSFTNVPFGKRSINVSPKLIVTSAIAATNSDGTFCNLGGADLPCTYVEFTLVNFSGSPVTVSNLRANYTQTPQPVYYRIQWGATNVFNCSGGGCQIGGGPADPGQSGVTTTFSSSQTIAAASTPLSPFTFFVDSGQTQLNDILIGRGGEVGTSVKVQIINFRSCSGATQNDCGTAAANNVNMVGVTFTVTLSDGSTVRFTPVQGPVL